MLKRKHEYILFWKLKMLTNCVKDLKITLILHNEMVLLMFFVILFQKREGDIKYGKTINNFFLGTVCFTSFCENHLFKSILIHIQTKNVVKKINTSFEKCASS